MYSEPEQKNRHRHFWCTDEDWRRFNIIKAELGKTQAEALRHLMALHRRPTEFALAGDRDYK